MKKTLWILALAVFGWIVYNYIHCSVNYCSGCAQTEVWACTWGSIWGQDWS